MDRAVREHGIEVVRRCAPITCAICRRTPWAGAPIQVIQVILRHENVNTTRLHMGEVSLSEQERWMRVADNGDGQAPRLGAV
jgi:hypothetical protein